MLSTGSTGCSSVFYFTFSVFQSRKTVKSIEIDGYGSTCVKLEKGNRKSENLKMQKWKTVKLLKCKTKNTKKENGGHDSIQMF